MRTQCGHCTEIHTSLKELRDCARSHGFRTAIPGQRPAAFEPTETRANAAAAASRAALTEADLYPEAGARETVPALAAATRRPAAPPEDTEPPSDAWKKLPAGKYAFPGVGEIVVRISGTTGFPYASIRQGDGGLEYVQGLIRKMDPGMLTEREAPQAPQGRQQGSEPEAGLYFINGAVHKVQRAVHGSGRMYAKMLNLETGEWERARGAASLATAENRLTPERAMEIAKECQSNPEWALYGHCFICGRTLTDEESISAGIGPICIGKLGSAA